MWYGFGMGSRAPKFVIVLAAGKGTRMHSTTLHKVCFPIDGRPAINRALDTYRACGIACPILVVGSLAGQVMETVGREHPGAIYAYQAEQLGTADAARQGARVLDSLGVEEEVLIVAGDRLLEPLVLERLFDLFYGQGCDLAFLAVPGRPRSSLGRILLQPDGSVLANVEVRDIRQRQVYREIRAAAEAGRAPEGAGILQRIRELFTDGQAKQAFGDLWRELASGGSPGGAELLQRIDPALTRFTFLDPEGRPRVLSPEEVDSTPLNNTSVYLVRTQALRRALGLLGRDNAQGEEYLSDLITLLAQARSPVGAAPTGEAPRVPSAGGRPLYRVRALQVKDPHAVMGFNDPAELLEIENHLRSKRRQRLEAGTPPGPGCRPLPEWLAAFRSLAGASEGAGSPDAALREELGGLYGDEVLAERVQAFLRLLEQAARILGPGEPVLLVRSPGRVNLMGRHVDHQGGHCNLMTIGYETLMAVRPRQDDRVRLFNLDAERFPPREFSIGEMVAELPWDDWVSLVDSEKVSREVLRAGGDWGQYVRAAALRLQKKFSDRRLRGADLVVSGNIPMAAGLSSSSSLVVATAEAMVAINGVDTFPAQLVNLSGEGEWYVGTRGGSADHAAIKYGQRGQVIKVTFFEFAVEEVVPFPPGYVLAVCDSGHKARKTANARDQFNHRVACYRLGFRLIRRLFPQYAPLLRHLRDVNTRNLKVPLAAIYRLLLHLPERAGREELQALLPGEDLQPLFETHRPPEDGQYPLRGVVLYGLAEFERSRLFSGALREGRLEEVGRLMNVSHDGDRVMRHDGAGEPRPWSAPTSNTCLLNLIEDLESGDPQRVLRAQLEAQPGAYRCSIPEIDRMVDIALGVPGTVGAQLAGAGLGGCMMVLTRGESFPALQEALAERYYRPCGQEPSILVCRPIGGSGVLLADRERGR